MSTDVYNVCASQQIAAATLGGGLNKAYSATNSRSTKCSLWISDCAKTISATNS
ncbi:MAG: hypothetical protein PVSMB1_13690 [Gemmatimonadaceae bacterium]